MRFLHHTGVMPTIHPLFLWPKKWATPTSFAAPEDLGDNDVFIQHNGIGDRDLTSAARVHDMAARLRLWQQQVGDTAPLPGV